MRRWVDVAAVVGVALVLRLPAYLASAHLTFDDGVFGASALAMRSGGVPFRDVFSSQGPLFLPLIWLFDAVGLRTASSPRLLAVLAGLVLVATTWAIGRMVSDRFGAVLAAGLVATSIGVLGVSGPLAADGPAMAFGIVGVALAVRWRASPALWNAVGMGVAVGCALSVKSLLVPAVVPVALVLLSWRRVGLIVAGAGAAVAVNLAVSLPWGLSAVWDQSYAYHLEVAHSRTPGANLGKTISTLGDRELPLVVAAVLCVGFLRATGRRFAEPRSIVNVDVLLGAWIATTLAVLLLEQPMWRPHVAHLVPATALLVARHRPRWEVLAVAAVAVVPYHVVHAWFLLSPDPYGGETAAVVDALRDLPPGALAISDEPGLVWRAGRRTTDDLVDASFLRQEVGDITSAHLASVAAQDDVCAVAVRSRVRWGSFEDLPERLADAGYEVAQSDSRGRVLYLKSDCRPTP